MSGNAKILLVDDRPENLVALEAVLGILDHALVRARSGDEALKALLTDEFAVILLDVSMPGMDGFETAEHIKRRERTRDVPIIFLTAVSNEPHHAFRGYAAGAVDYIGKPFDPWVLRAKVNVFVDLYRKNRRLRDQAALLRGQLGASTADQPPGTGAATETGPASTAGGPRRNGATTVVRELSSRLAAVEEQVERLEEQATSEQAAPTTTVEELKRQVSRLRETVDALRGC